MEAGSLHLREGRLSYATDSRMDFLLADHNYTLLSVVLDREVGIILFFSTSCFPPVCTRSAFLHLLRRKRLGRSLACDDLSQARDKIFLLFFSFFVSPSLLAIKLTRSIRA